MKLFQWALFAACLGSMACGAQASPALVAQATTAPVTVPSVRSSYPPTVAPVKLPIPPRTAAVNAYSPNWKPNSKRVCP